jgi:hypothetical protein
LRKKSTISSTVSVGPSALNAASIRRDFMKFYI